MNSSSSTQAQSADIIAIDDMKQYISNLHTLQESKEMKHDNNDKPNDTSCKSLMMKTQNKIDDVLRKIHCLHEMGYERIAKLCLNVVNNTDGLFAKVYCWNVCALTGMTCNNVIQIRHGNEMSFVHPMFYQFVVSLWLVTRIQHFECQQQDQNGKISHKSDLEWTAVKYASALMHVNSVLDATLEKFQIKFI